MKETSQFSPLFLLLSFCRPCFIKLEKRSVSCAKNRKQGSWNGHLSENLVSTLVKLKPHTCRSTLVFPKQISTANILKRKVLNPFLDNDMILMLG